MASARATSDGVVELRLALVVGAMAQLWPALKAQSPNHPKNNHPQPPPTTATHNHPNHRADRRAGGAAVDGTVTTVANFETVARPQVDRHAPISQLLGLAAQAYEEAYQAYQQVIEADVGGAQAAGGQGGARDGGAAGLAPPHAHGQPSAWGLSSVRPAAGAAGAKAGACTGTGTAPGAGWGPLGLGPAARPSFRHAHLFELNERSGTSRTGGPWLVTEFDV
jgi:hypothetical protein